MVKKYLIFLLLFLSVSVFSQKNSCSLLDTKELKNTIILNYTRVHMPDELTVYGNSFKIKPTMYFVGLNYNIPIINWLYTGAGMHCAITGDQGSLFTLGVNLGVNKQLYKHLYFDANVHFSDGGGILYSNIGLQYKTDSYSFVVQCGKVDFFTGFIKNNNVSFFIEIPSVFRTSSYKDAQKEFIVADTSKDKFWQKPSVQSVQQITFDFFYPNGDSRIDSYQGNKIIDNTLYIIGFEYQRYLTHNTFIYAQTATIYKGLVTGFMDLFIGVGKNSVETKYVNLFAKFNLSAHDHYHRAIGVTFEAYTSGFSLKYYGLKGSTKHPFTGKKTTKIKTQGIQLSAQNQAYFNVAKFVIAASDLQLIALKINYNLNNRFYLIGEASFPYQGKSDGYTHGLFGLGIKSIPFSNGRFSIFAEANVGVAVGGRINFGEGVLVRPTTNINFNLIENFSIHASGGQMISPFGNENSTNFNIGLS